MRFKVTITSDYEGRFSLTSHKELAQLNPKELMLYSAALCSGLTLDYIAKKKRVEPSLVEITVEGELSTAELMPESIFTRFYVIYRLECMTIEEQRRLSEAATLTHEKYCGLMNMLRKIAPINHEISIVSEE